MIQRYAVKILRQYFKDFDFVGATDSSVPCAIVIDVAIKLDALLTARTKAGYNSDKTLQLIFFDGEEAFETWGATGLILKLTRSLDSLYGSRHLSQKWNKEMVTQGNSVLNYIDALVLLDLLGSPDVSDIFNMNRDTTWFWERIVSAGTSLPSYINRKTTIRF
jgi:glutaminyl-peptide cyclotransferase